MHAIRKYRRHPGLTDEEVAVLSRVELELKLEEIRQEDAEVVHGLLPATPSMETRLPQKRAGGKAVAG